MSQPIDHSRSQQRRLQVLVAVVSICVSAYIFYTAAVIQQTGVSALADNAVASTHSIFAAGLMMWACIFRSVFVVSRMSAWKSSDKCAWALLLVLCSLIAVPVFSIWSAASEERMPPRLPFFTVLGLLVVISVVSVTISSPMFVK